MAERAYVALGSNLGDRAAHLDRARVALTLLPSTRLVAVSSVEETAPLGAMAQPPYLNQMVALHTALAPESLLSALHAIERAQGRQRGARWGARTIDLDLVRYGERRVRTRTLTLPHPGIESREFWQRELAELACVLGEVA
ncbi:MAG TPA: 2-amino-4-hydroxy-6-hydroxymethyldihydropteridine diphosphokinase [Gemmatimonadaceae bacterium]|nr:2-amino-4-hydroxy-6-hydroxymethyldihydropteridine diphosphokinase [Gemmatimonadaceae bacterium]